MSQSRVADDVQVVVSLTRVAGDEMGDSGRREIVGDLVGAGQIDSPLEIIAVH
jgi:hypothetical protein